MAKADKFTPKQIEVLTALLGWSNMCCGKYKIEGSTLKLDTGHDYELSEITPSRLCRHVPMEIEEDGFLSECKSFTKDLKKGIAVNTKCWGDLVIPVLMYVKE